MASDKPNGEASKRNGYLVRHWRGHLSLARSFWINYGLVYFTISGIVLGAEEGGLFSSFRVLAAVVAAAGAIQSAAFVWMLVGNWRSAGNAIRRIGRRFWPWAARILLMVHAAILLFLLPRIIPFAEIALGFDPFNKYVVTRTGSQEILIRGLIGANLPGDVFELLDQAPEVTWIRLESGGGRVGPARELARMIIDRGLSVRVWDECSSACVLPFLAADVRALSRKARIGLHRYSDENGLQFAIPEEMARDRQFLIKRGVSEAFLDKAYATPPDDMWYPSFEELVAAGVVTHVMEDGETRPVRP